MNEHDFTLLALTVARLEATIRQREQELVQSQQRIQELEADNDHVKKNTKFVAEVPA